MTDTREESLDTLPFLLTFLEKISKFFEKFLLVLLRILPRLVFQLLQHLPHQYPLDALEQSRVLDIQGQRASPNEILIDFTQTIRL